ncbi:MAG TPA: replisome organizer, partial [Ruminococcaceae bacterium]|nr:replisome organizer [Oscillospiraceae bacterium]
IKNSAFEELIQNNYIIPFNSGVIAIKHWKVNNYIQKDRYKTTIYTNELESLEDDKNIYVLTEKGQCIQNVYTLDTQDRLGKDRLGKESLSPLSQNAHTRTHTRDGLGEYENVYLTDSEIEELRKISPMWMDYVFQLSQYMKSTGKTYENHYATLVRWIERDEKQ